MNKGAFEPIGCIKSLAADMGMGISFSIELTAAALGVVNRRGIGKMSHISTLELLMQNATRNQENEVHQIDRGNIVSDVLAKKVKAGVMEKHMVAMRTFSRNDTVRPRSVQSAVAGDFVHQKQQR